MSTTQARELLVDRVHQYLSGQLASRKGRLYGAGSMPSALSPSPRRLGSINWLGLWTLYLKEVRRFSKVATQTIVSPLVTTLLYLVIFSLALGRSLPQLGGVSYAQFLMPGLIMMSMAQNAFANTSSSSADQEAPKGPAAGYMILTDKERTIG